MQRTRDNVPLPQLCVFLLPCYWIAGTISRMRPWLRSARQQRLNDLPSGRRFCMAHLWSTKCLSFFPNAISFHTPCCLKASGPLLVCCRPALSVQYCTSARPIGPIGMESLRPLGRQCRIHVNYFDARAATDKNHSFMENQSQPPAGLASG